MIKTIVTDVNGVLLPFNERTVRDSVIASLKHARSNGVKVALCTSNPVSFVKEIVERAGLSGLHIIHGGRYVYDTETEEVIEMTAGSLKKDAAKWLLDTLNNYPHEVLGVGDMPIDLGFMGLCGEVATMHGAHSEVIDFVKERDGFMAPSVEEDGFVKIIENYFS
ncbi:MAG: HAD family hydrolase [Patescibacteria group bacterium]